MTRFERAYVPPGEGKDLVEDLVRQAMAGTGAVEHLLAECDGDVDRLRATITGLVERERSGPGLTIWRNDIYQVHRREIVGTNGEQPVMFIHLSIKRIDREPVHDWRDLQQIKNELAGPEREAIEIYPPESQLVDTANQYHLWVLPEGCTMEPLGFREGRRVTDLPAGKAINRSFDKQ